MPPRRSTPKILHRAGVLRKQTTAAEQKLWIHLRVLREQGVHFRRQHAIGPFITDFCAPRIKLVIEVDGSQHLHQQQYDSERSMLLESQGYRVLRFWNNEVMNNIEAVMLVISNALEDEPWNL